MPEYYVNKAALPTGEHQVHRAGCEHLAPEGNRIYLGSFDNHNSAVAQAKRYYAQVTACQECTKDG